ncbi:hypothetical protein SODALDRAFT_313186 [Sodiomyces alkalinus F11]|uniref:Probable dipeptidyl-aminopeptidase B n=1 Tax=Sodiomyces alkalinus (strain CBS 110278 / VKM F-3762 / F11) TaxID=1314773 RepID=A0A3N2PRR3_SODAK|nr:hypothetical protein SODALDRAFT_313186 [Sodiomyces alkalinus F11]ROT37187.1 hypothetical protein SODALDRAFT_313186 [Sodiomyces alkalinus F11]
MDPSSSTEAPIELARSRASSVSSISTTSIVFDRLHEETEKANARRPMPMRNASPTYKDDDGLDHDAGYKESDATDLETGPFLSPASGEDGLDGLDVEKPRQGMDKSFKRGVCIAAAVFVAIWFGILFIFLTVKSDVSTDQVDDGLSSTFHKSGKPVTLDQVLAGFWRPASHSISWIPGPDGEDGLLLEQGAHEKDYLVVQDVRSLASSANAAARDDDLQAEASRTLMKERWFSWADQQHTAVDVWPSPDLKKVLVSTLKQRNWRHSFTAVYWIFDVESQTAEPLVPDHPEARVQLATWNSQGDAVVFTRENNMYLRKLSDDDKDKAVIPITEDGGPEYFYGIPDWVYEEEVFGGRKATWWSGDGKYIAFLRTNETEVVEYPVQYFVSRPSGDAAEPGEEYYPETSHIKYPKAGSPNPTVDLMFYDVSKDQVFSVEIEGDFPDDDRLINFVMWAGDRVLVKTTNRVSDVLQVVLIDVAARSGKTVRRVDVAEVDGGWFEITQSTRYIPADPERGRPDDGYVDSVIHDNGDHLAYFSPVDNPEPVMVTKGTEWEVAKGPLSVDLKNNLVYFSSTEESSIQRHIYSVFLNGTGLEPFTDTSAEGYYDMSFSSGGGYGLLSYNGPQIPWQKVVSTPGNPSPFEHMVEENKHLEESAKTHQLPRLKYGTLNVEGFDLNYVERRPPNFDETKKYPVLFYQYSGPGSQSVTKKFTVDFQSYVASALGYLVVTVDGRGTGSIGRRARVAIRDHLGRYEALDQIAAAQHWAAQPYVDPARLAIWGWSFGGFNTLKTLEADGGRTFRYGMAVAPVTDWRFYDSVYTERYMRTPQLNPDGYAETAVTNVTALAGNVRFLLMHGVADDNVHFQNTLTLLDRLDVAGVENYDVHVFPDSDHSIYFHNANRIVYDKLSNWLINAFNGEWVKVANAKPKVEPRRAEEVAARRSDRVNGGHWV